MLNLVFWLLTLAGLVALIWFAWRSAMRRRGIRLIDRLGEEGVLRACIDVPVRMTRDGRPLHRLRRRGTVVLTKRRLAGFTHRSRFVFVPERGKKRDLVRAQGEWLVIRPAASGAGKAPEVFFQVGDDADGWARETDRVLRGR